MASELSPTKTDSAANHSFTVLAGDCHIEVDIEDSLQYRGQVLVVVKPDNTILVHDIDGYQPVAWMTRADQVTHDPETGTITAVDGDRWLEIQQVSTLLDRQLPGTSAGKPLGECPDCGGQLVNAHPQVHCVSCRNQYTLPAAANIVDERCSCGLPQMTIEHGDQFTLCIDRDCEPMEEVIGAQFNGTWACPDDTCTGSLHVIRRRNLLLACNAYPECDVAYRLPAGVVDGHCGCGLPRFTEGNGSRCLDASCETRT